MHDLIILGVGVHAAEMVEIVARVNEVKPTWNLLGFLSPAGAHAGEALNGYPVLASAAKMGEFEQAWFLAEFDWPRELAPPVARAATLVDPSSFVSRTASLGPGCVIYPNCFIGLNASLGEGVLALSGCVVNHDDVIGDHAVLTSGVTLAGNVEVGADCYLGQGCTVRQHVHIGRNCLIGMGAVVVKDAPSDSVMVGNPAPQIEGEVTEPRVLHVSGRPNAANTSSQAHSGYLNSVGS